MTKREIVVSRRIAHWRGGMSSTIYEIIPGRPQRFFVRHFDDYESALDAAFDLANLRISQGKM